MITTKVISVCFAADCKC